jgi:hypothetical protein
LLHIVGIQYICRYVWNLFSNILLTTEKITDLSTRCKYTLIWSLRYFKDPGFIVKFLFENVQKSNKYNKKKNQIL